MRVAFVIVAAMLFCAPVFAQGVKLKSVTNSIGMELIEIPAGKFTMGSPESEEDRIEDEVQVRVTLTKPFGLGKTEVTWGQWKSVMRPVDYEVGDKSADKDCPVTYVSWDYATEFCEKLTELEREFGKLKANEAYRLPTEAEWEYACRAGTTTAFSFGDDESKFGEYGWFNSKVYVKYAHSVGLKKQNPWGLHDMHGNVWEWCSDWYDEKLSGGVDPVGPNRGSYRVFRGGEYASKPGYCRSASRINRNPSFRINGLGFRVARSQSETVTGAERRQQGAQAKPVPQVAIETRPVIEKSKPVGKVFKPGQTITNSIGLKLIEIPAGTFMMSDDVGVVVTLTKSFELGKYEVTNGQWNEVMGMKLGPVDNEVGDKSADKDCPVTGVSWDDAKEFCEKLTNLERKSGKLQANEEYRFPTEAEWEYACRAGTTTAFSFVDDEKQLGEYAWFNGNAFDVDKFIYKHKVGMKKPNPWGLHDMHGNVWEWCSDWYDEKLSGGVDPVGPNRGSYRVYRGGCYMNNLGNCRSANRCNSIPSSRFRHVGFRVARSQSVQ